MTNKPKRVQCRIGDIFEVRNVDKNEYGYFQFCALDYYQLNSDVIAVFEGLYDKPQEVETVVSKPIEFFTHTSVRYGVPELWQKIGKAAIVDTNGVVFKGIEEKLEDDIDKDYTDHWHIWRLGEEKIKFIGKLSKVPDNAEIGLIYPPDDIPNRIFNGKYDWGDEDSYWGAEH